MSQLKQQNLQLALTDVRLPHQKVATMIHEAALAVGDEGLAARLRLEPAYHDQAAFMTQSIVLGFTMAQTMNSVVDFVGLFRNAELAQSDPGLAKLGLQLVDWMAQETLAEGTDITRDLFDARVGVIRAAI